MLNFYKFYNKTGLDNEHYGPLIKQMLDLKYTIDLKPIEHIIKKSPKYAYYYARDVIKGRWHEAESHIIKDPEYACWYGAYAINERWTEVESTIMKSPRHAYYYALCVIKERWAEAESHIKEDVYWWPLYCKYFNI